jgi:hypothetical protein
MLTTLASLAVANKSTVGLHADMPFATGALRVLELNSSSSCNFPIPELSTHQNQMNTAAGNKVSRVNIITEY